MDDTDKALLRALTDNGRASVTDLARALRLARTTVQSRLDRLEATGIIAGYTIRLGGAADRARIRATVLLQIRPRSTPTILSRLRTMDAVERAVSASGRFDLILQLGTDSTSELDETLDRIGAIDGVMSSESLIHLGTKIDRGA